MPKTNPSRKPSRAPGAQAQDARQRRAGAADNAGRSAAGVEVTEGEVSRAQAKSKPEAGFGADAGAGAPGSDTGAEAGSAAEGLDPGPGVEGFGADAAPQHLTGEQLLELCDMSKGLLVRLVAVSWKLEAGLVDKLAPINPATRSLLSNFSDQAASFLPAANANAPLIGALAFAGLLAGDLLSTWGKMRRERPKPEPATVTVAAGPAPSPVVGAEDLPRPAP